MTACALDSAGLECPLHEVIPELEKCKMAIEMAIEMAIGSDPAPERDKTVTKDDKDSVYGALKSTLISYQTATRALWGRWFSQAVDKFNEVA